MNSKSQGAVYALIISVLVFQFGWTLTREIVSRYILFRLGTSSLRGFLIALVLAYLCFCPQPARLVTELAGCPDAPNYTNYGSSSYYFYNSTSNTSSGATSLPLVTGKGYTWGYRSVETGGYVAVALGYKINCQHRPRYSERTAIYVIIYDFHQSVRNAYCRWAGCSFGKYYSRPNDHLGYDVDTETKKSERQYQQPQSPGPYLECSKDINIPSPIMWEVIDLYFGFRAVVKNNKYKD